MNSITMKDEPVQKLYWSCREVARELHVALSLIHFWMREFHIEVKRSHKTNNRMFTAEDKERIREIYFLLKVQLFTLKGAKKQLEGQC